MDKLQRETAGTVKRIATCLAQVSLAVGFFLVGVVAAGRWATYLTHEAWHQKLIDAGFAEYDRKTGEWYLLKVEDIGQENSLFGPMPNKEE